MTTFWLRNQTLIIKTYTTLNICKCQMAWPLSSLSVLILTRSRCLRRCRSQERLRMSKIFRIGNNALMLAHLRTWIRICLKVCSKVSIIMCTNQTQAKSLQKYHPLLLVLTRTKSSWKRSKRLLNLSNGIANLIIWNLVKLRIKHSHHKLKMATSTSHPWWSSSTTTR